MEYYDEKKILHERKRREELKKLEQDKAAEKAEISEQAKAQAEAAKKRYKDMIDTKTGGSGEEQVRQRKTQLELEKEQHLT